MQNNTFHGLWNGFEMSFSDNLPNNFRPLHIRSAKLGLGMCPLIPVSRDGLFCTAQMARTTQHNLKVNACTAILSAENRYTNLHFRLFLFPCYASHLWPLGERINERSYGRLTHLWQLSDCNALEPKGLGPTHHRGLRARWPTHTAQDDIK